MQADTTILCPRYFNRSNILGIENFEEKINKYEETEDKTWTDKLLKSFHKYKTEIEKQLEGDGKVANIVDSLEPPGLEPRWGLKTTSFTTTTQHSEAEGDLITIKVWDCIVFLFSS